MATLESRLDGIERVAVGPLADWPPLAGLGQVEGGLEGRAERWTPLLWHSEAARDPDCRARRVSAVLVDAAGRWHALEAQLDPAPRHDGDGNLAFGVKPDAQMGQGQARIRVRMTHDCRGAAVPESTPWLPFALRAD